MPATFSVAVLIGSLRKAALSRLAAKALIASAPPTFDLKIVEIADLPLYNQDLEENPPAAWKTFRDEVKRADAVLFVTPEYNRSMPGALKNAIDVGSRPNGVGSLFGKPAAVMSVSPGALGGFGANHHVRQTLVGLNMPVLQQPEAYIGGIGTAFNADGALEDEGKRVFFGKFMLAFAEWVERVAVNSSDPLAS